MMRRALPAALLVAAVGHEPEVAALSLTSLLPPLVLLLVLRRLRRLRRGLA